MLDSSTGILHPLSLASMLHSPVAYLINLKINDLNFQIPLILMSKCCLGSSNEICISVFVLVLGCRNEGNSAKLVLMNLNI